MDYSELETRHKNHINGKLSQFMDAYIRQHKVWTPHQMHDSFFEKIDEEIKNNSYVKEILYTKNIWTSEPAIKWLSSNDGREFAMNKFQKKYEKDKPIASRKSPLVERVRFGLNWNRNKYYDINFGLKGKCNFIETNELINLTDRPWTIKHVNNELVSGYNTDLLNCLNQLSTSHIEKLFIDYWIKNYYKSEDNPAIIPEVCGFRQQFYYFELEGEVYTTREELPDKNLDYKPINFRFDFLIANFQKQKIAFIELDGFEYHKTRVQQTIDCIKRNTATHHNVSLLTFTSKRIIENIDSVFLELESYLKN